MLHDKLPALPASPVRLGVFLSDQASALPGSHLGLLNRGSAFLDGNGFAFGLGLLGLGIGLAVPLPFLAARGPGAPPRRTARTLVLLLAVFLGAAGALAARRPALREHLAAWLPPVDLPGPWNGDQLALAALATTGLLTVVLLTFLLKEPALAQYPGSASNDGEEPSAARAEVPTQPTRGYQEATTELYLGPPHTDPAPPSGNAPSGNEPSGRPSDGRAPLPRRERGQHGPDVDTRTTAPGPGLRGTVRAGDDTALARAVLTLIAPGGRQLARTASRADGHYELAAPETGPVILITAAPGYQPRATPVTLGSEPRDHHVRLGGTGGLVGTVRCTTGTPVADATVILTDVRGEVAETLRTDDHGGYALPTLQPGSYTLAVNAEGYRPTAAPVTVPSGETTRQDIEVDAAAGMRGVVRTHDGQPVTDARVTLLDGEGTVLRTLTTGADGVFTFHQLPCGNYTLVAAGYPPVATPLDLTGGQVERDVQLGHPVS